MNIIVFPAETRGLGWNFTEEPFKRYEVSLIFGRNKRDKCFVPLRGISSTYGIGPVNVCQNNKGTWIIEPGNDPGWLVFLTAEGGFRGGISIHRNEGMIIAQAAASAACESAIAVAIVLQVGQKITFRSTGRYGTKFITFDAQTDSVVKTIMSKTEYEFLFEEEIE